MRKLILTCIILMLNLFISPAFADDYMSVEPIGSPIVTDTNVTQGIMVNFLSIIATSLDVRAKSGYIKNINDPSVQIPISKLYLVCDDRSVQMAEYFQSFYTVWAWSTDQKEASLQLRDIKNLPAGTYEITLEFRSGIVWDRGCEFTFTFTVDEDMYITTNLDFVQISVPADDVFDFGSVTYNQTDRYLVIHSNVPWKLTLDTNYMGQLDGEYYLSITDHQGAVTSCYEGTLEVHPNRQYEIARGTKTKNQGEEIVTYLELEYAYTDQDIGGYIPGGTRENPVTYILEKT